MVSIESKKQAGFGAMAIVVVVLVIAGLGLIGWKLYSLYSKPVTKTSTTSQTTTQTNTAGNTGTSNQATYLDIKELGIKIKLDDSIKDAVYSAHTNPDGSQYADISTQSLSDKSNGSCGLNKVPMATITKLSAASTTLPVDNTRVFKLGDNYFTVSGPGSTCSDDQTVQDLANQQKTIFLNDFKTVQLGN